MVKAGGVFKRVLLCVQSGPKWAACQQGLKLGGKAGCRVGRNKGKLESMRTNSNLPVYPLLHPQPCGWLAGRSWQPSPPSHTGSWPRPHEVEGDQQEVRPRRPSCCPRPPRELADQQPHGELHLAPYINLVGIMAIASLPSSKSHTNFSCGQP